MKSFISMMKIQIVPRDKTYKCVVPDVQCKNSKTRSRSYYPMRNHRPTWVMLPSRAIAVFTFVLM